MKFYKKNSDLSKKITEPPKSKAQARGAEDFLAEIWEYFRGLKTYFRGFRRRIFTGERP
jgi:hypothetical protein